MAARSIISTERRSRVATIVALAAAGAAALGAAALLVTVDLPDVPAILAHVTDALGSWTYALVAALVFMVAGYAFIDALGEHVQAAGGAGLALVAAVAAIWALRRRSRTAPRAGLT